jgi:hypothetical protein
VQAILDEDPDRRVTFDVSTQAAMVFNRFVILTARRLEGNAKVRLKRSGRMMTINFGSGLILRFKKFDDKLRSRNIRTNSQALIYWQMTLDGMDPATNVTFGYQTDVTARNVTGVFFTCPVGWSKNKWVIPVDEQAEGALPFVSAPREPEPQAPGFKILPPDTSKTSDRNG